MSKLQENFVPIIQTSAGKFQFFVNKQRISISSSNPEQFKVNVMNLRMVPLLSLNFKQTEHLAVSMQNVGGSTSVSVLHSYHSSRTTEGEIGIEQQPVVVMPSPLVAGSNRSTSFSAGNS